MAAVRKAVSRGLPVVSKATDRSSQVPSYPLVQAFDIYEDFLSLVGSLLNLFFARDKLDHDGANPEYGDRSIVSMARCNRAVILAGHLNLFTRGASLHVGPRSVDEI